MGSVKHPAKRARRHALATDGRGRGFTLVELVVTVSIIGILAGIAGPAVFDLMIKQRLRNAAFELMADLVFARSEAVKRNSTVTITRSGTWTGGWTITDSGGNTLRTHPAFPSTISITATNNPVVFNLNGRATSSTNFTIDDTGSSSAIEARCVALDASGKPRSITGGCS